MLGQLLLLIATLFVVGFFLVRDHRRQRGYFAGRKPENYSLANDDRDWPALVAAARAKADAMARPAVALAISDTPIGEDPHSSLGGRPSLADDQPWPLDDAGKPMIFLAQINFGDMPRLDGYPTDGLLSFFVKDDELNGCDFPSIGNKGFLVIYRDQTADLLRRDIPAVSWDCTPFALELPDKGRRLTGRPATGPISPNSAGVLDLTNGWNPACPDELYDMFLDDLTNAKPSPLYYGGHPDFTQDDFRRNDDAAAYSEVLLQLGYLYEPEQGIDMCWGDAGEACFLITKEDLAERRFDRVAYYWDCT